MKRAVLVILAVLCLVGAASATTVVVPDYSFTNYYDAIIRIDSLPGGLSGYSGTLTVSDPTKYEIVSVTHPAWAVLHTTTGTLPGSTVDITGADTGSLVQSGATNTELVTVKLHALDPGSATLTYTSTTMDNDVGGAIGPAVDNGAITVDTIQGLHFSGPAAPTVIPTNVDKYYEEIADSNLSWGYAIGPIVPEPLVDLFGGGDLGWRLVWFTLFGAGFLIMFGRQKNVILPMMVCWLVAFFLMDMIPEDMQWMVYGLATAALMGVIFYIGYSRR